MLKKSKNINEFMKGLLAITIMLVSSTFIIFNNVGQSLTLFELSLSKSALYWIAGVSFVLGSIWTLYLNKIIKS